MRQPGVFCVKEYIEEGFTAGSTVIPVGTPRLSLKFVALSGASICQCCLCRVSVEAGSAEEN